MGRLTHIRTHQPHQSSVSYTRTYQNMLPQTHEHTHTCAHTRTRMHTHTHPHTRTRLRTRIQYTQSRTHARTHARTLARTHARTHARSHIYTTLAALCAKICPKNRTDFYPQRLNSTPIIAYIFLRLHIASPRPLERSLFAFVLCSLRQKIKNNFASSQLRFLDDIFMRQFSGRCRHRRLLKTAHDFTRLRTTTHN